MDSVNADIADDVDFVPISDLRRWLRVETWAWPETEGGTDRMPTILARRIAHWQAPQAAPVRVDDLSGVSFPALGSVALH